MAPRGRHGHWPARPDTGLQSRARHFPTLSLHVHCNCSSRQRLKPGTAASSLIARLKPARGERCRCPATQPVAKHRGPRPRLAPWFTSHRPDCCSSLALALLDTMAAASSASAPSRAPGAGVEGGRLGSASALPQVAPLSKYKMCFLGDQGVGKTSIIRVFVKGSFSADYKVRWLDLDGMHHIMLAGLGGCGAILPRMLSRSVLP